MGLINSRSARLACLASAALACVACSGAPEADGSRPPADMILQNARVHTMSATEPLAESVAVSGGRIVYVGEVAGAAQYRGKDTVVIDLAGKTVLPGFVSAHDHLVSSSWLLNGVHLFDVGTIDEALLRVREYAAAHPDEEVITGIGWTMSGFGRYPTSVELDQAVADRPAILMDYTGHDAWLNSAALAIGGIDRETPDRQPGTSFWVRDDLGNPTGVAVELEWMPVYVATGAWQAETMLRESTQRLFAIAASHGTTTLQNPGLVTPNIIDPEGVKSDLRTAAKVLEEMDERGELVLRVQIMPLAKVEETDPADIAEFAAEMSQRYDSDMLRVHSLKIHPAANMESYGSAFIEPYADKDTRGYFGISPEHIEALVLEANARGIDVVIHVWGDAEVRAGIDAFETARKAGYSDARNSLHHLGFVHPDDYQRLVDLAIPINVTPMFTTDWSGQDEIYTRLLGEERVLAEMSLYPDLAREGVNISISADTPSSGPYLTQAPLYNVESAVTLRAPMDGEASKPWPSGRQGMPVAQALRAVTIDAAWQLRMEDRIGSLEDGKYADLVILDKDPFEVAPTEIDEIRVLGTMMGGKFTFRECTDDPDNLTPWC